MFVHRAPTTATNEMKIVGKRYSFEQKKKKNENNYHVDCRVAFCNGSHRRTPPTVLFRYSSRVRFVGQCCMCLCVRQLIPHRFSHSSNKCAGSVVDAATATNEIHQFHQHNITELRYNRTHYTYFVWTVEAAVGKSIKHFNYISSIQSCTEKNLLLALCARFSMNCSNEHYSSSSSICVSSMWALAVTSFH